MSRVFYTEKQPSECISCTIDFSSVLGTTEIISSVDATGYDEEGLECWSTMGGGSSVATGGKIVSVGIVGGSEGVQYHFEVYCTLNSVLPNSTDNVILEADLYVTVKDL